MRYLVQLTVIVEADRVSAVNDDAMGDALIGLPGVVSVHGASPVALAPDDGFDTRYRAADPQRHGE